MNSERQHAVLSASGSDRWIHCPPSVRLGEGFADKGSDYALEGTCAHALAEYKLRKALGQPTDDPPESLDFYDEEMDEATDGYTSYVLEQVQAAKEACADPAVMVEQRVDFSRWVKQGFGTADALVIADGTLHVIDLKYGTGIEVSAEDNPQLKCYALGALELFDDIYDIDVAMSIYQPRRSERQRMADPARRVCSPGRTDVLKPAADLAWDRQGRILLRRLVPVLQGEEHLPRPDGGEPEARAARLQASAGALRRGDRGHPLQGGRVWSRGRPTSRSTRSGRHSPARSGMASSSSRARSVRKYTNETSVAKAVKTPGTTRTRGSCSASPPCRNSSANPVSTDSCRLHREAAGQTHPRAGQRQAPGDEHSKKRFQGGKTIMSKRIANPMKVITGPSTRWSYANVWEPKSINGGTPEVQRQPDHPEVRHRDAHQDQGGHRSGLQGGRSQAARATERACRPCRRSRRRCATAMWSVRTTMPTGTLTSSMRTPRPLRASWTLT
jgi:hypothetical protein